MTSSLLARTVLLGVAMAAVVGCGHVNPGQAEIGSSASISTTTAAPTTADATGFHPRGFPLPEGVSVAVPGGAQTGAPTTLRMSVGDIVRFDEADWLPDNPSAADSLIQGVLVLAADDDGRLTYQAVRPGTVLMAVGPVGHPGGCDQPGKSCADATPPPMLRITVTS